MRALTVFRNGLIAILLCAYPATASDHSGSVYPVGAETVLPGLTPGPGGTMLYEFTGFYQANSLMNSKGQNEVPGFHLGVEAIAVKLEHNWGVRLLGGSLVSAVAVPLEFQSVTTPGSTVSKSGIGNPEIGVAYVAYQTGALHWWYGLDCYMPGLQYSKAAPVNIGQHNFATVPVGAFSWLPDHGRTELSSRVQYIMNYTNSATQYRSGKELTWEFAGMRNVTKQVAVGINGYWYQQTTNDLQDSLLAGDGNRGRDFAIGPEIRAHLGRFALIAKFQRDTLVENRPCGSMFWLQLGVPLGGKHE